jgi:hypothetical protein
MCVQSLSWQMVDFPIRKGRQKVFRTASSSVDHKALLPPATTVVIFPAVMRLVRPIPTATAVSTCQVAGSSMSAIGAEVVVAVQDAGANEPAQRVAACVGAAIRPSSSAARVRYLRNTHLL